MVLSLLIYIIFCSFKFHFAHFSFVLLLFLSGKQNVNINSDILTFLSDVDKIKDLNWCKYILDSLVKAKLFWEERQTHSFPGSLLFLMVLL